MHLYSNSVLYNCLFLTLTQLWPQLLYFGPLICSPSSSSLSSPSHHSHFSCSSFSSHYYISLSTLHHHYSPIILSPAIVAVFFSALFSLSLNHLTHHILTFLCCFSNPIWFVPDKSQRKTEKTARKKEKGKKGTLPAQRTRIML